MIEQSKTSTGSKVTPVATTRIQKRNIALIADAALEVFSSHGYRGSTVDQIAKQAGLSKPNLLYYFPSKEAVHDYLLSTLMVTWLDPLREIDAKGEPLDEILGYVRRKLELSRDHPSESRLFANEIVQGAPRILPLLETELKSLVDDKAALFQSWMDAGRLAKADPHHLIFSIWSLTQHYADFDVQVRAVLGCEVTDPFPAAEEYLITLFTRMLKV
ncbi:TetR family transcriptional regulator C-terminal domain-containing protein [Pseudooceanicola sp.]|uniref:TetR family transcriptional regulator C-terminal domain-containing protein n=1 Tax=Pseudooceanicola sp. TaxID=1914328 RepID=UPI00260B3BA3|nr:TetR family transcriptional regulator C-terminal domain-containing protein [Pseudooceanicola sp.]MDF1854033.1 TetR family transcriptional regulator C-terminal domain-containing protein [Pseudooceanicola sp.]